MKTLKVDVSDEDWESFKLTAKTYDSKAVNILTQFVRDVVCSSESGGSDERDIAGQWLDRSRYNF